jgi:hypothetical protein
MDLLYGPNRPEADLAGPVRVGSGPRATATDAAAEEETAPLQEMDPEGGP